MTERLSCLCLSPLLMVRRATRPCLVFGALLGVMGCGNGENNGTSPDPEATSLQFSIQPADVAAGTGFSVEVRVVDAAGQIVATATATIQLTLEGGAGGAGLSGVVALSAVVGRATFSNLAIEVAASGYALRAASGALTAATSSSFTVLPSTPAGLAFDVQPSDVQGNEIFGPVVAVSIVDQFGNVVTTASDPVTLTLSGTDAELLGTGTVAASQGIAVFTDLRVDRPGSGFTLSAQAGTLVAATSSTFDVRLVFLSVHPGGSQVCGLTAPGHAYCWGNNGSPGGLGIGIFGGSRDSPVLVVGGLLFTLLTSGANHVCGLLADGTAYCWGGNLYGRLGDETTENRNVPTPVSGGMQFALLVAADGHTCGIDLVGATYCWGANFSGQLGDGSTVDRLSPTLVSGGLTFTDVVGGIGHTCALTGAGVAYCWGMTRGDGTFDALTTPTLIGSGLTFQSISAEFRHTCGVLVTGEAYCWGENDEGRIGDGTSGNVRLVPTPVTGGLSLSRVSVGTVHSCARTSGGDAYCWGDGVFGQLGHGILETVTAPVAVSGGLTFNQMESGQYTICGLTDSGEAYCWGSDSQGSLGDGGGVANSPTPVRVVQ